MKLLNYIDYYTNIVTSKIVQNIIIKYDSHTYSSYFEKERKYAGRTIHTCDETNLYIKNCLELEGPFLLARYGSTELYNMEIFDLEIEKKYKKAFDMLSFYSGFFPNDLKLASNFKNIMIESSKEVDIMAIWNMFMEERYIKRYMKNSYLTQLRFIEPWFSKNNPWTEALKGKKVLVIHPFADTIQKQYKNRKYLFDDDRILPDFTLITMKAVQTLANQNDARFENWFEALNYMANEAVKIDFDVVLIGCGAYGMPLAAKLKKQGKKAIHMGGVLQILFGIKGARWDDDPIVSKLYNEYWVRPGENEKINKSKDIEGGCYW